MELNRKNLSKEFNMNNKSLVDNDNGDELVDNDNGNELVDNDNGNELVDDGDGDELVDNDDGDELVDNVLVENNPLADNELVTSNNNENEIIYKKINDAYKKILKLNVNDLTDKEDKKKYNDKYKILKKNIERSNRILELIEKEMVEGNFSARLVEVAGQLMSTITTTSKELISESVEKKNLQMQIKMLEFKYNELEVKKIIKEKKNMKPNKLQQNIIVSNREDILKVLGSK